jgi:hypothetical protein
MPRMTLSFKCVCDPSPVPPTPIEQAADTAVWRLCCPTVTPPAAFSLIAQSTSRVPYLTGGHMIHPCDEPQEERELFSPVHRLHFRWLRSPPAEGRARTTGVCRGQHDFAGRQLWVPVCRECTGLRTRKRCRPAWSTPPRSVACA